MPLPQEIGRYGAIGFELVASIGAGFFVGRAVDTHFRTHGVALWIGFFLGVLGGFALLVRTARQLELQASKDDDASAAAAPKPALPPAEPHDPVMAKLEAVEKKIADDDDER